MAAERDGFTAPSGKVNLDTQPPIGALDSKNSRHR